jgi:hypothetical protein
MGLDEAKYRAAEQRLRDSVGLASSEQYEAVSNEPEPSSGDLEAMTMMLDRINRGR